MLIYQRVGVSPIIFGEFPSAQAIAPLGRFAWPGLGTGLGKGTSGTRFPEVSWGKSSIFADIE